ncbi:flippase [Hoeflea sp. TYP-13]|uniref:flippase n=1 Tax=Hoeflea sp. TYP-13 TaxID=3230023 RepID=UPI0034C5B454
MSLDVGSAKTVRLHRLIGSDSIWVRLLRDGGWSVFVRVLAVLASLACTVTLARLLGPSEYGIYAFILAVVSIISLPVQMGLPTLIVRETSTALAMEDWPLARGVWVWSTAAILACSVIVIGLIVAWAGIFGETMEPGRYRALLWSLPLIPLLALGEARAAALRGLHRVFLGQFPENVLRPLMIAGFVVIAAAAGSRIVGATQALALHGLAALLVAILGSVLLIRACPDEFRGNRTRRFENSRWLRAIIPLSMIGGLQLINHYTDLLMLGLLRSDAEVGLYRVALSAAGIAIFGLTAVNIVIQPYIARFHALSDTVRLQRLVSIGSVASMGATLPVLIFFTLGGKSFLSLVFGVDYSVAFVALIILCLGQSVSAFFGPVGNLLAMSGHERENLKGLAASASANVVLNAILIPLHGAEGAATATAVSVVLWNICFWISARRLLGIDSTPFFAVRRSISKP